MKKLNLNENFISRIWEDSSYYQNLKTTDGFGVEVLNYGSKNIDSGADYKDAKVRISGIIYTGDIEIHRSFKDWKQHGHKKNGKYNKVILQIVFWDSEDEINKDLPIAKGPRRIPTVVLSKFLVCSIHSIWKEIINNPSEDFKLPCYPKNLEIYEDVKREWINAIGLKRLQYKTQRIKQRLNFFEEDIQRKIFWEQVLFEFVLEALGFSKNKKQFLKFASKIDLHKIKKRNLDLLLIDSIFYGAAGFLNDLRYKDDYILKLKSDWKVFKERLNIESMHKSEWNFFRLRPSNFPTVRLAYASGLCFEIMYNDFFKRVVLCFEKSTNPFVGLQDIFSEIIISNYWNRYYNFGKKRSSSGKIIGKERITDIINNVILPLLFLYSKEFNKEELRERVTNYFLQTKVRGRNEITRIMEKQLSYKIRTVSEEQGMIHLHNFFCVKGKCNECKIGKILFERVSDSDFLKIILY